MLFFIAIYSAKNDNKPASEMKNLHQRSLFVLGPILTTGLKWQGGADLHTPDVNRVEWVWQHLCTVMMWVLSSVIIIAQSDTRNIEYVIEVEYELVVKYVTIC